MIIVSTSQGLYNLTENKFFHQGCGIFFGLTKYKDSLLAVCGGEDERGFDRGGARILFFNRELECVDSLSLPYCREPHGIEVVGDKLYCLSTDTEALLEVDLPSKTLTREIRRLIRGHDGPWEDQLSFPQMRRFPNNLDCNGEGIASPHMNTIKKIGDYLYIVAHRDNNQDAGCVYRFDPVTNESFPYATNLGRHSHSLVEHKNEIWTCDSNAGTVFPFAQIDSERGVGNIKKIETEAFFDFVGNNLMTRGLAVDDFFYIGLSKKSPRNSRHTPDNEGYILCLDIDSLEVCNKITIEKCGQVNEILSY